MKCKAAVRANCSEGPLRAQPVNSIFLLRARAARLPAALPNFTRCMAEKNAAIPAGRSKSETSHSHCAEPYSYLVNQAEALISVAVPELSVEGFVASPVECSGIPFLHRLLPADLLHAGFEIHALG
ncbi:hypothetical protein RUA4292_02976 [Ruegeria atlantica]|uniref:Uncharacterized protein n=1 Tax=Ruegeria atlantica TaxID=81569 RepID=A0A0P1F306_9RHOB|nr:hypothetical protein RUA4292_02976 [Ruegeria atlantica]